MQSSNLLSTNILYIKSYSWKPPWFSKSQKWKVILQKTQNDLSKPTRYTTNNYHIHYHSRMYIHSALRAHKKEQWKITWLLYGNWLWSKLSSLLLFRCKLRRLILVASAFAHLPSTTATVPAQCTLQIITGSYKNSQGNPVVVVKNNVKSRLEAHAGFFRLLMKGIFNSYILWPFDKKLIS